MLTDRSKWPSNQAAGETKTAGVPNSYVEDFCEPRTQLEGIFSGREEG